MKIKKVGVIGAGVMGKGITVDLLLHGISVILVDLSDYILEESKEEIIKSTRFAPIMKKDALHLSEDEICKNITFTKNLGDIQVCDFIIESVTEKWTIKEAVYRQIDKICDTDICFGVNTSCISITKIGGITDRPDKVIGMHFMNPVFLKSSIEMIRGFYTSEDTIEKAKGLLMQIDKKAIIVNDSTGFVANRISHLYMNEAAFIVQDQVATPEQVDEIFKKCYGHKMGPLETADLIGLDTIVNSLEVLYENFQDSKFRCCPLLRKMVDAGLLGRKTGKGFYKYS